MGFTVDGKKYLNERAIATQQTGWSFVAQTRGNLPDAVGGRLWFGTDDTNTTVYMPFYCSMTEIPLEVRPGNGDMLTYSDTSNFWINNRVANQAYHRYDLMIDDIRKVQSDLENGFSASRPAFEEELVALAAAGDTDALVSKVNNDGADIARTATDRYRDLERYLMVRFVDGNRKKLNDDGTFARTPEGIAVTPDFPGYDEEFYRHIANSTGDRLIDRGDDIATKKK